MNPTRSLSEFGALGGTHDLLISKFSAKQRRGRVLPEGASTLCQGEASSRAECPPPPRETPGGPGGCSWPEYPSSETPGVLADEGHAGAGCASASVPAHALSGCVGAVCVRPAAHGRLRAAPSPVAGVGTGRAPQEGSPQGAQARRERRSSDCLPVGCAVLGAPRARRDPLLRVGSLRARSPGSPRPWGFWGPSLQLLAPEPGSRRRVGR